MVAGWAFWPLLLVLLCYFGYISNLVKKSWDWSAATKVNQKQWNQGQEVEWNLLTHKNDLKKLKLANQGRNKGFICKAMKALVCYVVPNMLYRWRTKQNKTGRHLATTLRRDRLHFGIGMKTRRALTVFSACLPEGERGPTLPECRTSSFLIAWNAFLGITHCVLFDLGFSDCRDFLSTCNHSVL